MLSKRRAVFLALVLITILAGLASRRYSAQLPVWFAEYAGDALWGLMVYWLMGVLFSAPPIQFTILQRFAIALSFAFAVEFSQLYQAPWLNSIRETRLGGLVLGFGFLWTDLVCYTAGNLFGCSTEAFFKNPADDPSGTAVSSEESIKSNLVD